MKKFTRNPKDSLAIAIRRCLCITPFLLGAAMTDAQALTVNVVAGTGDPLNPSNVAFSGGYRWMIQEDQTKDSVPGLSATGSNLSYGFHSSQSPVVANGHSAGGPLDLTNPTVQLEGDPIAKDVVLDTTKRYYISILPDADFAMGAAKLPTHLVANPVAHNELDTAGTADVIVQPQPIPTAQISLFLHVDNAPINNTPDLPAEACSAVPGSCLPVGFTVKVYDAGGGYGAVGGQMSTDAFGNPLGTEYNPDGSVPLDANGDPKLGSGSLTVKPDGTLLIKNLAPGKYTIFVDPPAGLECSINPADGCWSQTATIEGTKGVDAWVKANEPSFFAEFGPPGHHVFIGFVQKGSGAGVNPGNAALTGPATVTGQIVNNHVPRPPDQGFGTGAPVDGCWVGINDLATLRGVYAGPCDGSSNFNISGLEPNHLYQLAIWDQNLDRLFALRQFTTSAGGVLDLGQIPVFDWFSHLNHTVFFDTNQNGFKDAGEAGIPGQAINHRFRDGRIYQSNVTDNSGRVEFPEVFPFFSWQIAEVDFARRKATGITSVTDNGGIIDTSGVHTLSGFDFTFGGVLEPQPQTSANESSAGVLALWNDPLITTAPCRTVLPGAPLGPVSPCVQAEGGAPPLLQSFQAHMGLTTELQWGKTNYTNAENGGISGIVHYALTRAEDLALNAAPDNWEPGIPHVQVALYQDKFTGIGATGLPDKQIDDVNGDGVLTLADVDNYPLGWADGTGLKGNEDVDRNGDTIFDAGDAINVVTTDAWDDNLPTGCAGDNSFYQRDPVTGLVMQPPTLIPGLPASNQCFDGLRTYQQTRDGVFDGGYGFFTYFPGGMGSAGSVETTLPAGTYIVESSTPAGYQIQMEEDKNVTFGDAFNPAPAANNLACIGDSHEVGLELALFPGTAFDPSVIASDIDPFTAGVQTHLCDRKQVVVRNGIAGLNAAADFYMFTEVPAAANVTGIILDDLANTISASSPAFGEKYAVPHLPVSFRDWTGKEIVRVYSDQNGTYNALLPSTFSANVPNPSGFSPNMMTACMNDPGPVTKDPATGATIPATTDPYFDRRYSQFCYTFQYMPGSTTHLDTPVLPVAAFAGPSKNPVDCAVENATPGIYSVASVSNTNNGPYIPAGVAATVAARQLRIVSQGTQTIINPAFDQLALPSATNVKTIQRDYGFGSTRGTVRLTRYFNGQPSVPAVVVNLTTAQQTLTWTNDQIVAQLPTTATMPIGEYQLEVVRSGKVSKTGVMVTVGGSAPIVVGAGQTIQSVIDAAPEGALIAVPSGTYNEMVVMSKRVRLQGQGAGSTIINANKGQGAEKLEAWRYRVNSSLCLDPLTGAYPTDACIPEWDLLPGQVIGAFNGPNNEPTLFGTEEGAAVTVLASDPNGAYLTNVFNGDSGAGVGSLANARIDGFNLTSSDQGGGVFVNGYAQYLEVGNNLINGNIGDYGGGVRVGHANLEVAGVPVDGLNDSISIHHNDVNQNGNAVPDAVGGGIAIYKGADNYRVSNNQICGNFSISHGGGIGHQGLSRNGVIEGNTIIFNQSFNQANPVHGGGIFIGGETPLLGALTEGSGSVRIAANRIQGNQAGAGDGGAIRAQFVNGQDVLTSPDLAEVPLLGLPLWNKLTLVNNMIVNNVAGQAGAVSLQDVAFSAIDYNTIANNDSTATAMGAFPPNSVSDSFNQPAGIVSYEHSTVLDDAIGTAATVANYHVFANPQLVDNIILHNRSFHFGTVTALDGTNVFKLLPDLDPNAVQASAFDTWDMAVLPAAPGRALSPTFSLLTDGNGCSASLLAPASPFAPACVPYNISANNRLALSSYVVGIGTSPTFTSEYFNHSPDYVVNKVNEPPYAIFAVGVALDEGGNQIDVRYNPLTPWDPAGCKVGSAACTRLGDYHIKAQPTGVDVLNTANNGGTTAVNGLLMDLSLFGLSPRTDFDGQTRTATRRDMGADER